MGPPDWQSIRPRGERAERNDKMSRLEYGSAARDSPERPVPALESKVVPKEAK